MAEWDTTFVRAGRTLGEWLPLLVSEDLATRFAAGEALGGMWQAKPAYGTRWDELTEPSVAGRVPNLTEHAERFGRAVREAVGHPGFPQAAFVRRLLLYRMMQNREWLERARRSISPDERPDAKEAQLIEQALTSADFAERERAAKRFGRMFCASLARDRRLFDHAESMQAPGMVSYVVLQALDTALLDAPDLLHEMLDDDDLRSYAVEALQRLGPAASPFVDRLLDELDREQDGPGGFDASRVLGNVARAEPAVADALVGRLRSGSHPAKFAAAAALEHAGPAALAGPAADEAVELLRGMVRVPDLWYAAIRALASVGRGRADVLDEVLTVAAPRPPRWRKGEGKYAKEYDEVTHERGTAIEALRYFTGFPDRVVSALTDAIETFEEYDPDWGYERAEHGRVAESLRAFGPAAGAVAAPVLARHVRQSDGDVDLEVVRLLGDIGPTAAEALPALVRLREEQMAEFGPPDAATIEKAPPERADDPIEWAIWRIGGGG
jgi:hypothetical protein